MFRTRASNVLIAVACVWSVAAVCLVWLDGVVLDTPSYVRTVAPLWRDAGIRDKAAREIGQHIVKHLDVRRTAESWLPKSSATEQLALAIRMQGIQGVLAQGIGDAYTTSPAFETDWRDANSAAHQSLVRQLLAPGDRAGTPVTIDVDIAGPSTKALRAVPATVTISLDGYAEPLHVEVLDQGDFVAVRGVLRAFHGRGSLAVFGFALLAALGVALARDRRKAIAYVGLGTAVALAFVLAGTLALSYEVVARMADWHLTPASVISMYDAIVGPLRFGAAAVMLAGAGCGYIALRRRPSDVVETKDPASANM